MAGKFEITKSKNDKFMFNLKAGNGQVVLTSQMYETKASAINGVASCKANGVLDERFERATSKADEPYFTLKASNGQVIGRSEMYSSASAMENGIKSVMATAPEAVISDATAG